MANIFSLDQNIDFPLTDSTMQRRKKKAVIHLCSADNLFGPEKTVINTLGDGAYMFTVPSACHFVSSANKLPILSVIFNNQSYRAVKHATSMQYPEGEAVRNNDFPMADLQPTANYEKICEAFGGYGERVENPEQLQPALERALYAVKHEKRQALLNVICKTIY